MAFNSFSSSLRDYAAEAKQRYALVVEHADELGGHPAVAPQGIHAAYWLDTLQLRYWNMAEYEGWPELPGFNAAAVRRILG